MDFIKQNFNISKESQSLLRNIKAYKSAINIIIFDLSYEIENKNNQEPINKLLKSCYKFLAVFAYNDITNQSILSEHYDYFLRHFKKNKEIDAQLVLIEIFRNNKKFLNNEIDFIKEILNCLIDSIEESDSIQFRTLILISLEVFLKVKNQVVKLNQTMVVSQLANKKYKKTLITLSDTKNFGLVLKCAEEIVNSTENDQIVYVHPEIDYFSTELCLLSLISEDKNAAAESKCQMLFSLELNILIFLI